MRHPPLSFSPPWVSRFETSTVKTLLGLAIGPFLLLGFHSSADAAIRIQTAKVQDSVAFIVGTGAANESPITWETAHVTTANRGGAFSFTGVVPADCVGTLSDGTETIQVVLGNCTPLPGPAAPVPQTGQATSDGPGDDGALQKGVALPKPRFIDNSDGTVTDILTGLMWLKNANCPGTGRTWLTALDDVVSLNANGTMNGNNCGDTSKGGSHHTDWRLPNIRELFSLVHFGFFEPALSNAAGTAKWDGSDAFTGFQGSGGLSTYWSSTANASDPTLAWVVDFDGSFLVYSCPLLGWCGPTFVLPVRGR